MILFPTFILILVSLWSGCIYAGMPGGYVSQSTADPKVQDVVNFAVATINKGSLIRIISIESQVVAGINYKLKLQILDVVGITHVYNVIVFVPLPSSGQSMRVMSVVENAND